ncbi:hypothetical protein C9374_008523 [Naegleria lovaniensis]|uniref:Uncharacterized protein n=1 Tax=Naegleria lovaniensis TaxID=51637 RepID=A0AA88GKD3_NAELO|nr:uncharacterized protein C9374_008523 [Naegleria lovaniensis]KAG2378380.1 hypothetical protein C9374_008523 [Naegleria lovaniensis]
MSKGGKGLGNGGAKRRRRALWESQPRGWSTIRLLTNPIIGTTNPESTRLVEPLKKKIKFSSSSMNITGEIISHPYSHWLNSLVLLKVFEYLPMSDQLNFRLINHSSFNTALGISSSSLCWKFKTMMEGASSTSWFGTSSTNQATQQTPFHQEYFNILSSGLKEAPHLYSHQLILMLEPLAHQTINLSTTCCSHSKMSNASTEKSLEMGREDENNDMMKTTSEHDKQQSLALRHVMHGCLLSVNAALRNLMIKYSTLFTNQDPFQSHYRDVSDPNIEELLKNQEYVELFKTGIVSYRQWIGYGNKYSQSSKCEIKIKRKSVLKDVDSNPYIYLVQQHGLGINCREGTSDQYYQLVQRKGRATIPILESLFYREPTGEAQYHKRRLQRILDECELPSEWNTKKFLSFLMLCSSSLLNSIENCEFTDTLNRIKPVMTIQEDENEECQDDEETYDRENPYLQQRPMLLYAYHENMKQTDYEVAGIEFMDKLISEFLNPTRNKGIAQIREGVTCLRKKLNFLCARVNLSKMEPPQGCIKLIQDLQSNLVTRHESYSFSTCIGEYVTEQDSYSKVTFRRLEKPEELMTLVLQGTQVAGYGDSFVDFSISSTTEQDGNSATTLEMCYSNEKDLFDDNCSKSGFLERLIGSQRIAQYSSIQIAFSLLHVMDRPHHFLISDFGQRSTRDHDVTDVWNSFLERFSDKLYENED